MHIFVLCLPCLSFDVIKIFSPPLLPYFVLPPLKNDLDLHTIIDRFFS